MPDHLSGKRVIITGGSSGFGLATARILLGRGARVAITGRDHARLASAVTQLGGPSRDLFAVLADATVTAAWQTLVATVAAQFDGIDALVVNHGAGVKIAPLEDQDDEAIDTALNVNLGSVIRGCRAVLPVMRAAGRGHIITVGSACSYHAWPEWSVYTAAKAGLVGFTRCLHLEMVPWGGKASIFLPGAARTGFASAVGCPAPPEGFPEAEDFAPVLAHMLDVPDHVFIEEASVWGTRQVLTPF